MQVHSKPSQRSSPLVLAPQHPAAGDVGWDVVHGRQGQEEDGDQRHGRSVVPEAALRPGGIKGNSQQPSQQGGDGGEEGGDAGAGQGFKGQQEAEEAAGGAPSSRQEHRCPDGQVGQ
jgi:hypothetical protein